MADELPPVIQAANRFRAAILRREAQAASSMLRAYGLAYSRLESDIAALVGVIGEMGAPTWGQVERLAAYQSLLRQIESEVGRFAAIAENQIDEGARAAMLAALSDSQRLVQLSLPGLDAATVRAAWVRLSPAQVETIMGFLAEDSPLFANLRALGPDVAELVANEIRLGVILGRNPREVARRIQQATGQGLTWALNMSRTAQLWAYREATRASFVANNRIVSGWMWWAEVGDPRTCMSCILMHGTEHTLDEVLNDHHAGRCLLPGQRVMTRRGMINIEDVKTGDMVLTHAGRYQKVTGISKRHYRGDVLMLRRGRFSVSVTIDHKVLTQRGFVEARLLSARDTLVTLNDVEVRLSRRSIVHPSRLSVSSFFSSARRFLSELCQRGSSSTASIESGKAKSTLNDSTANCGIGNRSAALSDFKKSISCGLQKLFQLACRHSAIFRCVSGELARSLKPLRNPGLISIERFTASLAPIGAIPQYFMSFINDRVLIFASAVSSRYVARSSTYRRRNHWQTGSPSLISNSDRHLSVLAAPTDFGGFAESPRVPILWFTALKVRSSLSAISFAVCELYRVLIKASSSSVHRFFVFTVRSFGIDSIIHRNGTTIHRENYSGYVYDLSVEEDHSFIAGGIVVHNCAMLPITRSYADLGLPGLPEDRAPAQTGVDWFLGLPPERQREIMGGAAFRAWQAGEIDLGQLSTLYDNDVYGPMRREASLVSILGERARVFYAR